MQTISSDSFLWYNVGDWADYGLAVPNFGNDATSQNSTIRYLVEVMGRNLQAIMWHTDSRLRTPPSINTIIRIHKLCIRARSILTSRAVPPNEPNLEPLHAIPSPEDFIVFPTPYFKVRNPWLKDYAGLALTALSEAMQHQENARPVEISEMFAGHIGQYVHRIYRMMAVDLLQVDPAQAKDLAFTLTDEQLKSYDPSKWFTSTELIDTVPELEPWPTEDQLKPLTDGILASALPPLPRWPSASTVGQPAVTTTATTPGGSFPPPPGP